MRHETSEFQRANLRADWMNLARLVAGLASLSLAMFVAFRVEMGTHYFALVIGAGLLAFAVALVLMGRDTTRRWLAFGALLGFAPASRRPLLALGTDRPVLHGLAGRFPTTLRIVAAYGEGRWWLEARAELPFDVEDARVRERAAALGAKVRRGHLVVRDPFEGFDEERAAEFLAEVAAKADAVGSPIR